MLFQHDEDDDRFAVITFEGHERGYLNSALIDYFKDAAIIGSDQVSITSLSTLIGLKFLRHDRQKAERFNRVSKSVLEELFKLMSEAKPVISPEEAREYGQFIGQLEVYARKLPEDPSIAMPLTDDEVVMDFLRALPDNLGEA